MNQDNTLPATLFTASLLSRWKDLSHLDRALITSRVRPFDVHSPDEAKIAVTEALAAVGIGPLSAAYFREGVLREAALEAEAWVSRGIYSVRQDDLVAPGARAHDVPRVLFAKGDRSILEQPSAAVLISRQGRKITPKDRWLVRTKQLVRFAIDNHYALVSSYGSIPYGVVSRLALGAPVILVCRDVLPFMGASQTCERFLSTHRDLFDDERTLFVSSFSPGPLPLLAFRQGERDRLVAALSSLLLVADVRPGGNMAAILDGAATTRTPVIEFSSLGFDVSSHAKPTVPSGSGATPDQKFSPEEGLLDSSPTECEMVSGIPIPARAAPRHDRGPVSPLVPSFLIHYTRSCPGPWAGQTLGDYCRSLIDGSPDACHTALDTLKRILKERLIRGSNKLTRGPSPMVSFTERHSQELEQLIRWRRALVRWSFEPYGIAIRTERLVGIGAKQVRYGDEEVFRRLPDHHKYLFQLIKPEGKDWSVEKEWRLLGDLNLVDVPGEDVVVIVSDRKEAAMIQSEFGLQVDLARTSAT